MADRPNAFASRDVVARLLQDQIDLLKDAVKELTKKRTAFLIMNGGEGQCERAIFAVRCLENLIGGIKFVDLTAAISDLRKDEANGN